MNENLSQGAVTAWFDPSHRHWRWYCPLCNEEHGTGASERDYDGPVQTAARNHIDLVHPGGDVPIEIRNADGDVDVDDDDHRTRL
jgi:hypothetical protein